MAVLVSGGSLSDCYILLTHVYLVFPGQELRAGKLDDLEVQVTTVLKMAFVEAEV